MRAVGGPARHLEPPRAALIDTDPNRVPPLALPPLPKDALLGTWAGPTLERAAAEAARTVPPREHGGNVDIKNLSIGSRVFYPVYVAGAKFSIGDLHFAQGDGEISFCGAMEMGGYVDVHVDLIKDGVKSTRLDTPIFQLGRQSRATPSSSRSSASRWTRPATSTTWTPRSPTGAPA